MTGQGNPWLGSSVHRLSTTPALQGHQALCLKHQRPSRQLLSVQEQNSIHVAWSTVRRGFDGGWVAPSGPKVPEKLQFGKRGISRAGQSGFLLICMAAVSSAA